MIPLWYVYRSVYTGNNNQKLCVCVWMIKQIFAFFDGFRRSIDRPRPNKGTPIQWLRFTKCKKKQWITFAYVMLLNECHCLLGQVKIITNDVWHLSCANNLWYSKNSLIVLHIHARIESLLPKKDQELKTKNNLRFWKRWNSGLTVSSMCEEPKKKQQKNH